MKNRLLYLDIARFWAVILVILYHTSVHTTNFHVQMLRSFAFMNNNYTGVVLFVLISGISLSLTTPKKVNWKTFYKKRFLAVLPLLWIAYILQYFRLFLETGTAPIYHEKWRIIFSIFGLDGYLVRITPTLYLGIGEWFIGMILVLYLLYPFLRYLLNHHLIIFIGINSLIYISSYFIPDPTGHVSTLLMIPIFSVGMYLGVHDFKMDIYKFGFLFAIFILFQIMYISFGSSINRIGSISDIIVSISGLLCLKYICQFITNLPIKRLFKHLSQMSYGMTLINQQVIVFFVMRFANRTISGLDMLSLYLLIILTIYVLSVGLNYIQKQIFKIFQ